MNRQDLEDSIKLLSSSITGVIVSPPISKRCQVFVFFRYSDNDSRYKRMIFNKILMAKIQMDIMPVTLQATVLIVEVFDDIA